MPNHQFFSDVEREILTSDLQHYSFEAILAQASLQTLSTDTDLTEREMTILREIYGEAQMRSALTKKKRLPGGG